MYLSMICHPTCCSRCVALMSLFLISNDACNPYKFRRHKTGGKTTRHCRRCLQLCMHQSPSETSLQQFLTDLATIPAAASLGQYVTSDGTKRSQHRQQPVPALPVAPSGTTQDAPRGAHTPLECTSASGKQCHVCKDQQAAPQGVVVGLGLPS